jgi:hypothetical protein
MEKDLGFVINTSEKNDCIIFLQHPPLSDIESRMTYDGYKNFHIYRAEGRDNKGKNYMIIWDVLEGDWDDEISCCDWEKANRIEVR